MSPMNRIGVIALLGASLAVVCLYLAVPALAGEGLAFPLDDSWIHQTYARSLAQTGQWAFLSGQPSAGSTAPLWTLCLAAGYALGVDGVLWSHGLGCVLLAATGWAAGGLAGQLFPGRPRLPWAVALFCVGEWHLGWAAVSGMETLLFTVLALALLALAVAPPRRATGFGLGLLGGLLTLTRPEGILLFALCAAALGWRRLRARAWRSLAWDALLAGGVCALLLAPLVWFNYAANGTPFPNTFSAKQQEYRVLLEMPYLLRWFRLAAATLIGGTILLLPGIAGLGVRALSRGPSLGVQSPGVHESESRVPNMVPDSGPTDSGLADWLTRGLPDSQTPGLLRFLPALWWLLFVSLYAWRLPVTYQHARYLIPIIPMFVIYGMAGTAALLDVNAPGGVPRVLSRATLALLVAVPLAFAAIGAQAYRDDVTIINRETVAAARWVEAQTPPDALVAAHDVGALGYFSGRRLVDLAGLVSPEAIPFLGDPEAMAAYVRARGADYLVQGLGFEYPALTGAAGAERVYTTVELWPAGAGHGHMEVWRLK